MNFRIAFDPKNGKFLFCIATLFYAIFPFLVLERMVLGTDTLTITLFPFFRFLSVAIGIIYLLAIACVNKLRLNLFSFALFFISTFAFIKGLSLYPDIDVAYFFTHISAALCALVFYIAGINSYLDGHRIMRLLRFISYVLLIEYSIIIFFAYFSYDKSELLYLENFHLSLNIAPIFLSFTYFIVRRQWINILLIIILIFLSGKRSLIFTGFFVYFAYLGLISSKERRNFLVRVAPFSIIFAAIILFVSLNFESFSFASLAINRLASLDFMRGSMDIDEISSGRWNEGLVVWGNAERSISNFLFGTGFGHFIEIVYVSSFDGLTYHMEKIGFDVLPIHLIYIYGVPASILIIGFIFFKIIISYSHIRKEYAEKNTDLIQVKMVLLLAIISIIINSFFTYLNPDPFLWFCLGLLPLKHLMYKR